jgi:hypothetical protein
LKLKTNKQTVCMPSPAPGLPAGTFCLNCGCPSAGRQPFSPQAPESAASFQKGRGEAGFGMFKGLKTALFKCFNSVWVNTIVDLFVFIFIFLVGLGFELSELHTCKAGTLQLEQ